LAVATVMDGLLGVLGQGPGLLQNLILRWSHFHAAAKTCRAQAFDELPDLRSGILKYMFATDEAGHAVAK
jgi:hypothetical protein